MVFFGFILFSLCPSGRTPWAYVEGYSEIQLYKPSAECAGATSVADVAVLGVKKVKLGSRKAVQRGEK